MTPAVWELLDAANRAPANARTRMHQWINKTMAAMTGVLMLA
jgi:hypothetical protein